jgi:uncharacterized membrane protein YqjE
MNRAEYSSSTGTDSQGIGSLLSGLLRDLQEMMRGEVALARAEIKEDVSSVTKGATSMAIAAVFALTGFVFLMLGLTYLLNIWMRMWVAAGIVGLVLLVIGGILLMSAKKKLSATSLKPTQTIDSLKETKSWAQQQMTSDNR